MSLRRPRRPLPVRWKCSPVPILALLLTLINWNCLSPLASHLPQHRHPLVYLQSKMSYRSSLVWHHDILRRLSL